MEKGIGGAELRRKEHASYQDVMRRRVRRGGQCDLYQQCVSLLWEPLLSELKQDLQLETTCLHLAIPGMNIAPFSVPERKKKCGFMSGKVIAYFKSRQKHRIPLYQYVFVLFRVSYIQKPDLDDRWKGGGWGIRFFTDVQPRNRTETDTEMSSDLLDLPKRLQDLAMKISCFMAVFHIVSKNIITPVNVYLWAVSRQKLVCFYVWKDSSRQWLLLYSS